MVGNTYPYIVEEWISDIALAHEYDIDGFVLNVGREEWQKDRVSDCFEAALRMKLPEFKLSLSFDMTSIPGNRKEDVQFLIDYAKLIYLHPNTFRLDGKIVLSTFAGENSLFGHDSLGESWIFVKEVLAEITSVHFIPSFFIDPAQYPELSALDGAFNWKGGWPLHLVPTSPRNEVECPNLDTDRHHIRHLGGRSFMAAVSPWFFTHYGPDSWNKNWIYRGDDWLFCRRWEQLVAARHHVDIVQVISWNDYGESHYIGPIKGAQPNSQAWVDGFPHVAWLHLNRYYARAFREGICPPIEQDRIIMWARPHPKDAFSPEKIPRPDNWELTDDTLWVVVFSTSPAEVSLLTNAHPISFKVQAGITKLSHPLQVDGGIRARMTRENVVVVDCDPHGFCFRHNPTTYNFNAFVVTSP